MKQKVILIGIIFLIAITGGVSFIWWEAQLGKSDAKEEVKGVRESSFTSEIILEIFNSPVTVVSHGNTIEAMEAKNGMVLKQGDIITTSNNGRAQIVFPNGTVTRLDKNTKVTLQTAELSPQQVEIVVNEGQIWSRIAELLQSETYVTKSEKVSASVRGTSYGHSVAQKKMDQIITTKGEVEGVCLNKTQQSIISKDQKVLFTCDKEGKPVLVPIGSRDKSNEWYLFNSTEDEELINRFGPFTYNDDHEPSVLGAADEASELAQNFLSSIQSVFSSDNTTTSSTSSNNSSTNTNSNSNTNNDSSSQTNQTGAQPTTVTTPQPTPTRAPVAKLASNTEVQIYDPSTSSTFQGTKGTEIYPHYTLTTTDSRAEIDFTHGSKVRMDTDTKISIDGSFTESFQPAISIDFGRVWNRVKNLSGQDTYESQSGSMVATVRGTAYSHEVSVEAGKPVDTIHTLEGKVLGKCKDGSDGEGTLVTGEKTVFNCSEATSDEISEFLETIGELPPQEAEWLLYNTALDFEEEIRTNQPPQVTITDPDGKDPIDGGEFELGTTVLLKGAASDDAKPFKSLGTLWTVEEGPNDCVNSSGQRIPCAFFSDKNEVITQVTFRKPGIYKLHLTASDIYSSNTDEVTITITGENQPPQVNAGQDMIVTLPNDATLHGTVTDDDNPYGKIEAVKWRLIDGPEEVRFKDSRVLTTDVTFLQEGKYILGLRVFDGDKWGEDSIEIRVLPGENTAPEVTTGPNQQLLWPDKETTLEAEVIDDGFINDPPAITWEQVGGPTDCSSGCTSIKTPTKALTEVTFKEAGTYIFEVTVNDGQLIDTATITVNIISPSPTPTPTPVHTSTPTPSPTPSATPLPTPVVVAPVVTKVETSINNCPVNYHPLCVYSWILIEGNNLLSVSKVEAYAGTNYSVEGQITSKTNTRISVIFYDIKAKSTFFLRLIYGGGSDYRPVKTFNTKNPNS